MSIKKGFYAIFCLTTYLFLANFHNYSASGNSSVVEHRLAKARVAGSNPVSRSILHSIRIGPEETCAKWCVPIPDSIFVLKVRRRSQVVRQRSAKPLCTGSNPVAASKFVLFRFSARQRCRLPRTVHLPSCTGIRLTEYAETESIFFCLHRRSPLQFLARVVELVDTRDLKSLGACSVPVRFRPRAPKISMGYGFCYTSTFCTKPQIVTIL